MVPELVVEHRGNVRVLVAVLVGLPVAFASSSVAQQTFFSNERLLGIGQVHCDVIPFVALEGALLVRPENLNTGNDGSIEAPTFSARDREIHVHSPPCAKSEL